MGKGTVVVHWLMDWGMWLKPLEEVVPTCTPQGRDRDEYSLTRKRQMGFEQ